MTTYYNTLKKKSGCPVVERVFLCTAGRYINPPIIGSTGERCGTGIIQIDKKMPKSEKIGTLAHEMGHRRCHSRRCRCYENRDWVLVEVHAELYALHLLLRLRYKCGIIARFKRLKENWWLDSYSEARDIIEKRRIYKRCQEFIGNGESK